VKARVQVSNDLRQMREALAAGHTLPARAEKAADGQAVQALARPGRKTR